MKILFLCVVIKLNKFKCVFPSNGFEIWILIYYTYVDYGKKFKNEFSLFLFE